MEEKAKNIEQNPKMSIIVPVYNVEKYLPKCLDSLVHQTLQDIEIILVDDASTDRSKEIMIEYAAQDQRIKTYFSPQNLGSGGARNIGIGLAKAEYITFVDADDWVELEAYANLYQIIKNQQADVLGFGLKTYTQQEEFIQTRQMTERTLEGKEISEAYLKDQILVAVWNKIYKRDLFENLKNPFPLHRHYQDMVGTAQILAKAHRFAQIDQAYYCYRARQGSITKSISLQHITDYALNFSEMREIYTQHHLNLDSELEYYFILHSCFCYQRIINQTEAEELVKYLELYQQYLGKYAALGMHRYIQEQQKHIQWLESQKKAYQDEIHLNITDEKINLIQENSLLSQENNRLTEENNRLTEEKTALTQENNRLTEENDQLIQTNAEHQTHLHHWQSEFAHLVDDCSKQVTHSKIFRTVRLCFKGRNVYQEEGVLKMLQLVWGYLNKKYITQKI